MGIVSSTFASLAIRFAWNCQRFLDPRYRYIEASSAKRSDDKMADAHARHKMAPEPSGEDGACVVSSAPTTARPTSHEQGATGICHTGDNDNSLHQQNRRRRATQHRYRKRPSSFDVSLIIRNKNKSYMTTSGLVTNSTPSTLMRQPAPCWDSTSTSGSSNDSSDDSDIEFMYAQRAVGTCNERLEEKSLNQNNDITLRYDKKGEIGETRSTEDDNPPEEFAMSAAEEAAFRRTIGRGYFSRSKKDRFLNNLRLEKRLNGLNKEFFELACRAHTRSLQRRHSGDLRRIV